jgi:hypothetical protein
VFGLEVPAVVAVVLAHIYESRSEVLNDLLRSNPVY